jgi:hypothetical protein
MTEGQPNKKGQAYTDDEIRLVLSHPPTKASIALLAAALGRTPNGIKMIYRRIYPGFSDEPGGETRQVRRIARQMGWVLPVGNVE